MPGVGGGVGDEVKRPRFFCATTSFRGPSVEFGSANERSREAPPAIVATWPRAGGRGGVYASPGPPRAPGEGGGRDKRAIEVLSWGAKTL